VRWVAEGRVRLHEGRVTVEGLAPGELLLMAP
jgi:hypothetical protein